MKKLSVPKVSLVITSYHSDEAMVELTRKCIASLKYGRPDEVILVDDASPIREEFEGIDRHVRRLLNGGFPKCANTGFMAANGEVIILSNNDIEYTPGWLEGILKPLNEGYDISTILVSDADGYVLEDKITEGDKYGSLWAITRKAYGKVGGFDESFELGTHEDLDHRRRALDMGLKIGKYHGALVEHVGRATMDKLYPEKEDYWNGRETYIKKWGDIE